MINHTCHACLLGAVITALAPAAMADAPLFIVEGAALPFDLGPAAPLNNPTNPANLPGAPENSAANAANSAAATVNSPKAQANQPGSGRSIRLGDGEIVGYYTQTGKTLNLFSNSGKRVAYSPATGTKSLFGPSGQWCGTVAGTDDGGMAFGMTQSCASAFLTP